jgi:alkylation response protein AidB-like acyl-CoA dehydrogenase
MRAAMLAEIQLNECWIPETHLIGGLDFGWAGVAATALDLGRYSVAWGCVGIGQGCLEASLQYSLVRVDNSASPWGTTN